MITRRQFVSGLAAGAAACAAAVPLAGCSSRGADNQVIIYSSCEGNRNENLMTAIRSELPDLDVRLKYMSTGNLAARLKMEGASAEFDIALGVEAGYLRAAEDSLVPLADRFDLSTFADDLVISDKIMPLTRECGCFAHNTQVLARAGIAAPTGLDDLLDPRFQGLVTMPNPKASSTGYNFYYSMVNLLGLDGALDYFDSLAQNVYQFTSSGGAPTELDLFPEGVPWTMNGIAVVKGHEDRQAVWDVMQWFYSRGILLDKQAFVPDQVFKDQHTTIEGYPTNITYANMDGLFDVDLKERLLDAWKY